MSNEDVRLPQINAALHNPSGTVQTGSVDQRLQNNLKGQNTSSGTSADNSQSTEKRSQQDIQRIFQDLIKNTNLKMSDLLEIMQYANVTMEDLQSLDNTKFQQMCSVFKIAIQHEAKKGSDINVKNLEMTLISCKIAVQHKGLSNPNEIEEFINNYEKKDLLDILQDECPQLQGKKIENLTPEQLKDIFKAIIMKAAGNGKKTTNPQAFMDFFMGALGRCDDKEKAKIFYAFALLLKDEDMQGKIPEAYQKMIKTYDNIEELKNLINKVGPEILRLLGFDDETIKILNFEAINDLDATQIGEIINSFLKAFDEIASEDLPVLKKVLTSISNNDIENLTTEELKIYGKYKDLIDNTVSAIAVASNRPELQEQLQEHYKQLFDKLKSLGIEQDILFQVFSFYENNQDLFNNISKDDFIKRINAVSDNKMSEAIGDTNPENLYVKSEEPDTNSGTDYTIGFGQRSDYNTYQSALTGSDNGIIYNDESNDFWVEPSVSSDTNRSLGSMTFKELDDMVNNHQIEMDKILRECKSTFDNAIGKVTLKFMGKLNSVSEQAFNLCKIGSSIARSKIIDICNYDYAQLKDRVVLTVDEKRELEEKTENKDQLNYIKEERPSLG